jgi:hypothetical protein
MSDAKYDCDHADLYDVITEFREKADGCALYAVRFTDMTRDELLAVAAFLLKKETDRWAELGLIRTANENAGGT